ncbi:MAG: hypothetical protein QXT81_05790 [Candidatus Bathyarchaeia archaeon]
MCASFRSKISLAALTSILVVAMLQPVARVDALAPYSGFYLKHNGSPVTSIEVPVCTTFTLDFWIHLPDDLPQGQGMVSFDARFSWDPSQVEITGFSEEASWGGPRGSWGAYVEPSIGQAQPRVDEINAQGWFDYYGKFNYYGAGSPWTTDALWGSFTFHCRGEGTSIITVTSPAGATIYIGDDESTPTPVDPGTYEVTCNQYQPQPTPTTAPRPVGGEVFAANKFVVLSPYIALISVVAVAAVVIKRKLT